MCGEEKNTRLIDAFALPYLRAIAFHISDTYPNQAVSVWAEESPFFNDKVAIKARVDNVWAYTIIDNQWLSEEHISSVLIELIKEGMNELR